MLWTVENGPVHLVGSLHLITGEVDQLHTLANRLLSPAEVVVFEADFAQIPSEWGSLPPGKRLVSVVGEELWEAVERLAVSLELEPKEFSTKQPWAAAQSLSVAILNETGVQVELGVDHILRSAAEAEGKGVLFLESPDAQSRAFSAAPLAEQVDSLRLIVEQPELAVTDFAFLQSAWRRSDPAALGEWFDRRTRRFPATFAALIGRRNRNWLPKILGLVRSRVPSIVVVGALHFCGPASLPTLLAREGVALQFWGNGAGG